MGIGSVTEDMIHPLRKKEQRKIRYLTFEMS